MGRKIPSEEDLIDYIKSEYPRTRTAREQARIVRYILKRGGRPGEKRITTTDILDDVPGATRTHIDNLVEKVGLLEKFKPQGSDSFFYYERLDKTYFSPSQVDPDEVRTDVELLISECQDVSEVREFVADELGASERIDEIQGALTAGAFDELVKRFNDIVTKLDRSSVQQADYGYGRMGWRSRPNRFQATPAVNEVGG